MGVLGSTRAWASDRAQDVALWPRNLIRELRPRTRRLAGVGGRILDGSWASPSSSGALAMPGALLAHLSDLVGAPEAFRIVWHLLTHNTRLTDDEVAYVASVLGPEAIRYRDVRVAEGGILRPIFGLNRGRAFTTFHTINLPGRGGRGRSLPGIVVHELVHVLQHERLGSVYIGQCLRAQRREGYDYGGAEGLQRARADGKHLRHFNREQQAQIAEDFVNRQADGDDVTAYEPYIEELRRGEI